MITDTPYVKLVELRERARCGDIPPFGDVERNGLKVAVDRDGILRIAMGGLAAGLQYEHACRLRDWLNEQYPVGE